MNTSSSLTSKDWLKSAQNRLKSKGITSYNLDPIILLEDCLNIDRLRLLTRVLPLSQRQVNILERNLSRRLKFEPLAYIRGFVEFYGRNFQTNKGVLIPRPESEAFIEIFRSAKINKFISVADIGCGSGCIGITIKLEFPETDVSLYDISPKALKLTAKNADLLNAEVKVFKSNLLADLNNECQIIVANLPYVPVNFDVNEDVNHEPYRAIYAGDSGLNYYKRLFMQLNLLEKKPLYILTESLRTQHLLLQKIAISSGYKLITTNSLVQVYKRA